MAFDFADGTPARHTAAASTEELATLTPPEVATTARALLDPSRIRVVLRGDPDTLDVSSSGLAGVGLGAVGYLQRDFGGDHACSR